jgi:hypothetical protein
MVRHDGELRNGVWGDAEAMYPTSMRSDRIANGVFYRMIQVIQLVVPELPVDG